jgi:hypothetical protein
MPPRLTDATYARAYTLSLRFADGTEGEVDLASELDGEAFEPLKDLDLFRAFTVSPEVHTVTWPNGADFAPEFLYEQAAARRLTTRREG